MFKDSIFVLFYFSYIQSNLSLLVVRRQESFLSETRIKVKTPKNPVSSGRTLTGLLVFLPLDACLNTRSHSTLTKWVDQSVFFLNTRSAGRCRFLAHSAFLQVRVDSGIQEGSDISIYYDPMISKVSDIYWIQNVTIQFQSLFVSDLWRRSLLHRWLLVRRLSQTPFTRGPHTAVGQTSKSPLSVTVNKFLCFLHLILTKKDKYNDKNEKVERCQSCTLTALSQAFSKSHDITMPEVRQLSGWQQKSVTYSNQGL